MACYCPHIRCYDCDNYGHVAVDCPDKIPPSGTPAHSRTSTYNRSRRSSSRHNSHTRCSHHEHINRFRFSCSRSRTRDHSYRNSSCHDPCRSKSRSLHRSSCTTTSHIIEAPALTTAVMIHPTTDIPGMPPRDNSRSCTKDPENTTTNWPKTPSSSSHTASWKSKDRKHKQVTIDDLHCQITIVQMIPIATLDENLN